MIAEDALKTYLKNHSSSDPFVAFLVTPGLEVGVNERILYSKDDFRHVASPNVVDEGGFDMDADQALCNGINHSFVDAAVNSFSKHYPFVLRPQQMWLLILQAVAEHVTQNSEELRSKWVNHTEGEIGLQVVRDDFVEGQANEWASVVDDGQSNSFASQIRKNAVQVDQLTPHFTGTKTRPVERIAQQITIMYACQDYYGYFLITFCGFPFIVMEGTLEDWKLLRRAAGQLLKDRCATKWGRRWGNSLLPLLDKLPIRSMRQG